MGTQVGLASPDAKSLGAAKNLDVVPITTSLGDDPPLPGTGIILRAELNIPAISMGTEVSPASAGAIGYVDVVPTATAHSDHPPLPAAAVIPWSEVNNVTI